MPGFTRAINILLCSARAPGSAVFFFFLTHCATPLGFSWKAKRTPAFTPTWPARVRTHMHTQTRLSHTCRCWWIVIVSSVCFQKKKRKSWASVVHWHLLATASLSPYSIWPPPMLKCNQISDWAWLKWTFLSLVDYCLSPSISCWCFLNWCRSEIRIRSC